MEEAFSNFKVKLSVWTICRAPISLRHSDDIISRLTMTRRTFSRRPTHQSPFSSCGLFSTFSHRSSAFSYKKVKIALVFLQVSSLLMLYPLANLANLLMWGLTFLGATWAYAKYRLAENISKFLTFIKIAILQWGVQWGGCANWGAYRKGVGQLFPAHPEQGESSFFCLGIFSWFCVFCPLWSLLCQKW